MTRVLGRIADHHIEAVAGVSRRTVAVKLNAQRLAQLSVAPQAKRAVLSAEGGLQLVESGGRTQRHESPIDPG